MRYRLTARWPALTDTFEARDEAGTVQFRVRARTFGLRDTLTLEGADGRPAARLVAGWTGGWSLVDPEGTELARIGGGARPSITAGGQRYEVRGDVAGREYQITDRQRVLATVSKRFFSLADQYGLEVPEAADTLLAVAIAVACHRQTARKEN